MTLEECYAAMEANYTEIMGRLRKETLVQKLLLLFPKDENYKLLHDSLASGDHETAFRAAHSLKGVSLNLGLTKLSVSASALTEALRGGADLEKVPALLAAVEADYEQTVAAITTFAAGLS